MTSQQSHQQPAPYVPPAPTPAARRSWFARHKILTTLAALVVVIIGASALNGGGSDADTGSDTAGTTTGTDSADTPDAPAAEVPAAELPGIGATAADGKFEFVVTQVDHGVARVGNDMIGQDAQGQYVLVHVTVTNIGDEAQYFDGSSQKATDTEGRSHSADIAAAVYLGDTNSFLNQINPGNQVEGVVVFDIPADATLAEIELHDSPFSGGVTVGLG